MILWNDKIVQKKPPKGHAGALGLMFEHDLFSETGTHFFRIASL